MTTTLPVGTYADSLYEQAHQKTFKPPQIVAIPAVLPPGLSQLEFSEALRDLSQVVGLDQVFVGDALAHYIDPYEIYEDDASKRKIPSAAVW